MTKYLNLNSDLGTHFYNAWLISDMHNIYEAYSKPSRSKITAYMNILDEYSDGINTCDLKVISKNSFHFTAAYAIKDDDEIVALVVHTPYTKYIIEFER